MYHFILVVHILVTVLLIAIILIQRSDSDGFALGGGGSNLMTGRASANLLTRSTALLAAAFMLTSLGLSLTGQQHVARDSIADQISNTGQAAPTSDTPVDAPAEKAPVAPSAPKPE